MSDIIFLNGPGSSGKTSIAKSIQALSDKPWLHFSMDGFIDMLPDQYINFGSKAKSGYYFFAENNGAVEVKGGLLNKKFFGSLPKIAKILADAGNDLIIDEVLLDDELIKEYKAELSGHNFYFIGIYCDFEILEQREKSRNDRVIGLAKAQFELVHQGARNYDLKIDTSNITATQAAKDILDFLA